ncbi:MAG: carotenoid oxygenase family protein [Burkholderiales bacterium]|nr:carotenoid oxygenase family protein [Burkholderiales bacterium]
MSTLSAPELDDAAPSSPSETDQPSFLDGPFAPVQQETVLHDLQVTGELPAALQGVYARIGPNPMDLHAKRYHWFIGDGMVHGVRLAGGQAQWYRSRWIGSNSVNKKLGRPMAPGPRRGVSDVVNTNVFGHAGRTWAATEAGMLPVQLDGDLNTVRHGLFDSTQSLPFSAHPHRDPVTSDLHAICYDARIHSKIQYVRVSQAGAVDRVVDIPVRHGPMIHDCAITASQVVVLDLPVTFSWRRLLSRAPFPYRWRPSHGARVGLLPRDGQAADMRWYEVDPCYVFHPCNAFDLPDGSVVMDVVAHEKMFDRSRVGPELDSGARLERWTLPAQGHQVLRQVLSSRSQEFPRLDERRTGRPYRWAYTVGFGSDMAAGQPLLRHDLEQGGTQVRSFGPHAVPGEFVFVPRSEQGAEDDGWLMGLVHHLQSGKTELHVLNADDFMGPAQAVVHIPTRIPLGFHGNWIADSGAVAPR